MNPESLTVDDVLAPHEQQLEPRGGLSGIRQPGLLASAAMQPQASFGGESLHEDRYAMAAAYLFHIVNNHPNLDGNKRMVYVEAPTFLGLNGVTIPPPDPEMYDATMAVAEGRPDQPGMAEVLRRLGGG